MPTVVPAGAVTYQVAKPRPKIAESGNRFTERECRCPECGDIVTPIHRRAIDRVLSVFVPVHRMRCPNFLCAWEGNVRDHRMGIDELLNSLGLSSAT